MKAKRGKKAGSTQKAPRPKTTRTRVSRPVTSRPTGRTAPRSPVPSSLSSERWAPSPAQRIEPQAPVTDLPYSYNETKLVLLVRDPYWAYSYWDFSGETWNWSQGLLTGDASLKPMIRVHDLDENVAGDSGTGRNGVTVR